MGIFWDKLGGWWVRGSFASTVLDGAIWAYNSASKYWEIRLKNFFVATASATVTNTTTETSIVGTGLGNQTLPADFFVAGKTIRVRVMGVYGTQAVPISLRIRVNLTNSSDVVVTVLDTAAQVPSGSLSNRLFDVEGLIVCRTTGATGTVFAQGHFLHAVSVTDFVDWDMENSAVSTIDTTLTQKVNVTAQWAVGVAASDTITGSVVIFEALN